MIRCQCIEATPRAFDADHRLIGCTTCQGWLALRLLDAGDLDRAQSFFTPAAPIEPAHLVAEVE